MNGMIATKMLDFQKQQKKHLELEKLNLTLKEKEILNLLVKGNSYKEIAGMIFISVETLKLAYQEYLPEGKWSLPG